MQKQDRKAINEFPKATENVWRKAGTQCFPAPD